MSRGSRFSTVLGWFREAAPDEVRAIMPLVIEAWRKIVITVRTPRPVVKRHRRTKAEMAAARDVEIERAAGATA